MPEALEVIESIISQHRKMTDTVNLTGNKMNDVDAVFNLQKTSYQAAWDAATVTSLLAKRDELLQTVNSLDDGLKKHFNYETRALPLVFGELLVKDIEHVHEGILKKIESVKELLLHLGNVPHGELAEKRLEMIDMINDLNKMVLDHKQAEEHVLLMIKKVFEQKTAY